MQAKLDRGKAAYRMRSVRLPVAIFAGVPLIAALAFLAPESALAACGASHPAGVHAATASSGVHAATSTPATAGGGGGVRNPRVCERRQRLGAARPAGRSLGPGDRDRRPRVPRHDPHRQEDHERQRAFARRQAGASRLTGAQAERRGGNAR